MTLANMANYTIFIRYSHFGYIYIYIYNVKLCKVIPLINFLLKIFFDIIEELYQIILMIMHIEFCMIYKFIYM